MKKCLSRVTYLFMLFLSILLIASLPFTSSMVVGEDFNSPENNIYRGDDSERMLVVPQLSYIPSLMNYNLNIEAAGISPVFDVELSLDKDYAFYEKNGMIVQNPSFECNGTVETAEHKIHVNTTVSKKEFENSGGLIPSEESTQQNLQELGCDAVAPSEGIRIDDIGSDPQPLAQMNPAEETMEGVYKTEYSVSSVKEVTCMYFAMGNCNGWGYPNKCLPSCSGSLKGCTYHLEGQYGKSDDGYCYSSSTDAIGGVDYKKICTCETKSCSSEYPHPCNGGCWKCTNPDYPHFACTRSGTTCCASGYPYYCEKNNRCYADYQYCDRLEKCQGSWKVCSDADAVPQCTSDGFKCCPPDYPYYCDGYCYKKSSSCGSCTNECSSNSCDSHYYFWCLTQPDGCKDRVDNGVEIGRCSVYCITDDDCGSNQYCSEDFDCEYICLDECSPAGSTRCSDSSHQETCDDYDSDPCLEWNDEIYCPYGCSDGHCLSGVTVHGYMKYSNGSGVPGVKFKLEDCSGNTIAYDYTDGDGYYSISATAGTYQLSVDYLGYDIDLTECQYMSGDLEVEDVHFDAEVSGYVKYSNGTGRQGVTVELWECDGGLIDSQITDSNGYYKVYAPDAGYHSIIMKLYGYEFEVFPCQAMIFKMTAPDVVLNTRLSGYVKYSNGNGRAGVTVRLKDCNDNLIDSDITGTDGSYTVEADDAGYYKMTMELYGYEFEILPCQGMVAHLGVPDIVFQARISGYVKDSAGNGKSGVKFELSDCDDNNIDTQFSDSDGYFELNSPDAGYFKVYMEYRGYKFLLLDCTAIVGYAIFSDDIILSMKLHGYLKDLEGNSLGGYDMELYDCSENFIKSFTTLGDGYFSLTGDADKYKIFIAIAEHYKLKLVDKDYNDCLFLIGNIFIENLEINPNPDCSIFNYMCYEGDIKLFNCHFDEDWGGCSCYGQQCLYGCTDGLPECDPDILGDIHIDVDNINDNYNPLPGASIYLEGNYEGVTDQFGKKTVSAYYGYRNVRVECPGGSLCEERQIYIDGDEYVYFDCDCTVDTDGDGVSDSDEILIGIDPNNPSENLWYVFKSNRIAKSCFEPYPLFSGIISIEERGRLLEVLGNLDPDFVTNSLGTKESIFEILKMAEIPSEKLVHSNKKAASTLTESDFVDGVAVNNTVILVMTDGTGVTSVFIYGAACTGSILGILHGAKQGLVDDANLVTSIIQGLWYYITHLSEINGLWDQIVNFFIGIPEIFDHLGDIFHEVSVGIFKEAAKHNIWKTDNQDYLSFQASFYGGYVSGYLIEQFFVLKGVGKAINALKIGAKIGELTSRGVHLLTRITNLIEGGGTAAEILRKTTFWTKTKLWTWVDDAAKMGAGRLSKYLGKSELVDDFLKHVDDPKSLLRKIDDVAKAYGDDAAEGLVKSKYGEYALKAGWNTDELKGLSGIISKFGDDFAERIKYFYNEGTLKITSKGVGRNVINLQKVNPDDLAKYVYYWTGDPIEEIGEHQLLRMYNAKGVKTAIGNSGKWVDDIAVLKKGNAEWGWEHIMTKGHHNDIKKAFELVDNNDAVKEFIQEGLERGVKISDTEIIWDTTNPKYKLRIILGKDPDKIGAIITSYPIPK